MSSPAELKDFRVEWTIDIPAASPEEAAKIALGIMRDPESTATYFAVFDEKGEAHSVDFQEIQT